MMHFMQLDERGPPHLLTTLRALLGAVASFLFGQPSSSTLGNISVLGRIREVKWLKEHIC